MIKFVIIPVTDGNDDGERTNGRSIWPGQFYDNGNGMYNFISYVLWCCLLEFVYMLIISFVKTRFQLHRPVILYRHTNKYSKTHY